MTPFSMFLLPCLTLTHIAVMMGQRFFFLHVLGLGLFAMLPSVRENDSRRYKLRRAVIPCGVNILQRPFPPLAEF
ncbi:hypothetical protein B0T21DRAFT_155769 [Apiosordaria backusii]|uniref:Uncharacterized protein n=1 Tax=Apiosordaria backusii TaxID=314023 RepID=A0AA40BMT2_9PEZI|nr:hypothetical protein B0T21DRAFT_155769 [Apiosordaria backusii]